MTIDVQSFNTQEVVAPITYKTTEWPLSMQESTCQMICRIAYDILSIIIFPIGLVRLLSMGIGYFIGRCVIPMAYIPEKISDCNLDEIEFFFDFSTSAYRTGILQYLESFETFDQSLSDSFGESAEQLKNFIEILKDAYPNELNKQKIKEFFEKFSLALSFIPDALLAELIMDEGMEKMGVSQQVQGVFNLFNEIKQHLFNWHFLSKEQLEIFRRVVLQHPQVSRVELTTPDGVKLDGAYFKPDESEDAPVVVYCNPNYGCYEGKLYYDLIMKKQVDGYNYLYFNYRGVAASEGSPSPSGLLIDGYTAANTAIHGIGVDQKRVIVRGYSLGGAIGAFAAANVQGCSEGGVACGNERSFYSLTAEVEEVLSQYIGYCIPQIASFFAGWTGWNWRPEDWWREITAYKWTVIHSKDRVVPENASLTSAWLREHPHEIGRVVRMDQGNPGDAHCCDYTKEQLENIQAHMHQAVRTKV